MYADRHWLRVFRHHTEAIGDKYFKHDSQRWNNWYKETVADAVLALVWLSKSGDARALVLHRFPNTKCHYRIGALPSPKDVMFDEICKRVSQILDEDGKIQDITLEQHVGLHQHAGFDETRYSHLILNNIAERLSLWTTIFWTKVLL